MYSIDIQEEFSQNFLDYAASVNWDRAIPRAQDGLKPVARRIFWAMYEGKYFSNKPHMKSARAVGDVMGKYHPHGDTSIYEAMIRLAKPWVMRYPLIDVHGNRGNVGGDGPASMRYTEARLTKLIEDSSLDKLNKDVVPMTKNYDETLEEPEVLPSVFPNLLCSPNQGIGVAQACYWLPHNLKDVANKIVIYIDKGELDCFDFYPDFPLGGTIVNPQDIHTIYETGKGKVIVEGKYKIKDNQIIFYEQPYEVGTENLVHKLKEQYEAGKLTQITDFQDQSGKKGFRLVFDLVPDANVDLALTEIFTFSDLRKSYSANCVAIRDMRKGPELLTLKDIIECYISHNCECIKREHQFDYNKAIARIEILEGLIKANSIIDEVIALIKKSPSPGAAKDKLVKEYSFTENQAKAILNMKLGTLSKLEGEKIEKELQEKKEIATFCEKVINELSERKKILKERLTELVKKYGDERRTAIEQKEIKKISTSKAKTKAEEIPQDIVVVYTDNGYMKAIPAAQYKKGKTKINTEFKCTTTDTILCFSSFGKVYRITAKDIGLCDNADKGKAVGAILTIESGEKILYVCSSIVNEKRPYMLFVSDLGMVKKSEKINYIGSTRNLKGVKSYNLKADEHLIDIQETNGNDICLRTKQGYQIRFNSSEVRATGKTAGGIKGITLSEGDIVEKCALCEVGQYPKIVTQKRGGKGKIYEDASV